MRCQSIASLIVNSARYLNKHQTQYLIIFSLDLIQTKKKECHQAINSVNIFRFYFSSQLSSTAVCFSFFLASWIESHKSRCLPFFSIHSKGKAHFALQVKTEHKRWGSYKISILQIMYECKCIEQRKLSVNRNIFFSFFFLRRCIHPLKMCSNVQEVSTNT